MNSTQLLVAPNGQLWDLKNGALHRYLGYGGDNDSLVSMATRRLGFVSLAMSDGRIRIQLRPGMFSAGSFEMVVGVMVRQDPRRIVIDVDDPRSVPQIFGMVEDAAAYLAALRCDDLIMAADKPLFCVEPLDLARIRLPMREALQQHFQLWRRRAGRLDLRSLREMQRNPLGHGQLFARVEGEEVIPETWPRYMKLYKPEQAARIIGKPFSEHQDGGYMHVASAGYVETKESGAPRLDLADASIAPPNGPPRRLRYERLMLPWRSPGGDSFVSTISFMRSKTLVLDD